MDLPNFGLVNGGGSMREVATNNRAKCRTERNEDEKNPTGQFE
jgi:hypothetical protein